ncbi:MAG: hypothetical protein WC471_05135 [Candidatus Woesearchaeota archaeon]
MNQIKQRFNLHDYKILSYSLYGKQKCPFVGIICEQEGNLYFFKKMLSENKTCKKIIKKEYELLKSRYDKLLKPELVEGGIRTRYIPNPSLSYYLTQSSDKKIVDMAISWLVKFHNEKHKKGFGHIHGDFSFDDIIPLKKKMLVLDWEDYQIHCEQLIDIYYLIFRIYMRRADRVKHLSKFINSLTEDAPKMHPLLKKYIHLRKIEYTKERRMQALRLFLKNRIDRNKRLYTIPTEDNYICRQILKLLPQNS